MRPELKPCPLCGSDLVVLTESQRFGIDAHCVECSPCGCRSGLYDTLPEDAVAAWNDRADRRPEPGLRERVRELAERWERIARMHTEVAEETADAPLEQRRAIEQIAEWRRGFAADLHALLASTPAESAPTEADQRAAFEAWAAEACTPSGFIPESLTAAIIDFAWEAWQAAQKLGPNSHDEEGRTE